ncbi:hypothetical protein NPIL_771 [Nephila pilipes]|uniref:Uncharacterized protein n=1 Tax=Nephila pilipes TaxID=299642 RepID=A0A8X6I427_NEPPI|nr:hypothetical protein NPIL_771 [Nephila pilipes]
MVKETKRQSGALYKKRKAEKDKRDEKKPVHDRLDSSSESEENIELGIEDTSSTVSARVDLDDPFNWTEKINNCLMEIRVGKGT